MTGGEANAENSGETSDTAFSVEYSECEEPGFKYPALVIAQAAPTAVWVVNSKPKESSNKQSKTKQTNIKVSNVVEINLEQSKVDEMQITKVKRSNVVQSIVH